MRCIALTLAAVVAVLAGCAKTSSVEVRAFRDSTQAVNFAAMPILDDLAVVERRVGAATADSEARTGQGRHCAATWIGDRRGPGVASAYCLSNAGYYAEIGDPPGTAKLRAGLATFLSFAAALAVLAEDANVPDAQVEIAGLAADLSALTALAGPEAAAAGAAIPVVATVLQPVFAQILKAENARRVRQIIIENHAAVDALVAALRQSAPAMYGVLASDVARAITGPPQMAGPLREERFAALRAQRARLDELVLLLGRAEFAWQAAYQAATTNDGLSLQLLGSSAQAARADLEAIRRARAAARNPAPREGSMP